MTTLDQFTLTIVPLQQCLNALAMKSSDACTVPIIPARAPAGGLSTGKPSSIGFLRRTGLTVGRIIDGCLARMVMIFLSVVHFVGAHGIAR